MTTQPNPPNNVPTKEASPRTTKPVDEANRLLASEITLSPATEEDAHRIVRPPPPPLQNMICLARMLQRLLNYNPDLLSLSGLPIPEESRGPAQPGQG